MSGIPPEAAAQLGLDYANFPPWMMMWVAFYMDLFSFGVNWRSHVPSGWADPGAWLSEEYKSTDALKFFPDTLSLSFEKFRSYQGYNVTPGSGALAGVHGLDDMSDYFRSLYEYMFETPSTALSNLWTPTSMWTVAVLVVFIKVVKAIVMPQFERIGRDLSVKTHGEAWLAENEERITKFGEYVFRFFYHSFISLVGFYYFWDAPWWDPSVGGTRNLYTDFPYDPVQPSMCWYYLFQAAYNVDAMVSLLQISFQIKLLPKDSNLPITIGWADTVRGDFNEMMAHHIVTNSLVYMSSFFRQTRIGSMVFWLHDLSDVPVDMAKLANFVKWKEATVGSFVLLCIMWFWTRLWVLPLTIWTSVFYEGHVIINAGKEIEVYFYTFQPAFLLLLGILIFLHAVWFSMFIKMGIVLVTKGETHDFTEHKKGEKQDVPNGTVVTSNGKKKIT